MEAGAQADSVGLWEWESGSLSRLTLWLLEFDTHLLERVLQHCHSSFPSCEPPVLLSLWLLCSCDPCIFYCIFHCVSIASGTGVGPDNLVSVGPSAVGVGSEGAFTGVFSAGSGCFECGCLDFEPCDFSVGGSEFHRCLVFFAAEADVGGGETGNGGLVGSSDGG